MRARYVGGEPLPTRQAALSDASSEDPLRAVAGTLGEECQACAGVSGLGNDLGHQGPEPAAFGLMVVALMPELVH
jgi:hypothetical protein